MLLPSSSDVILTYNSPPAGFDLTCFDVGAMNNDILNFSLLTNSCKIDQKRSHRICDHKNGTRPVV